MLVTFDVVRVIRACVRTARALNDVSGFNSGLSSGKVREKDFLFLAVLASETEIPLTGGKGAHAFDPRFLLPKMGERNGAFRCACSYKARRELRSRKKDRPYRSYSTL
jgi:hypothetical protein